MRTGEAWFPSPPVPLDRGGPTADNFVPFPESWVDVPVADILAAVAVRFGDRIAIDDGTSRLSYAETCGRAAALAEILQDRVPPGRLVALALPQNAGFAVAALACLAARRPFLALDLGQPASRLAAILQGARPCVAIADPAGCPDAIGLPMIEPPAAAAPGRFRAIPGSNDDPAVVLATSGSTGRPKRIVNSTAALLQRVLHYVNAGHLNDQDRFLTLSSPATIAGQREMLTPLLIGGTLHMMDARQSGLREVCRAIGGGHVTVYNSVPALLRSLLALGGDFGSLRLVRLGGEAVFWSDVALLRRALPRDCLIQIGYSSTETTGSQWFVPRQAEPQGATVPIGYLLPGNEAAVLDEAGQAVPEGEIGALWIRSRFVTLGQWEDGAVVPGSTRPDPEDPRRRILPTGDLVRQRRAGLIEHVGRADRQVKVNGQRAEPAELEAVLRWSAHVADAAVVTSRCGSSPRFVAFVVPVPGAPAGLDAALRRWLRPRLPGYLRPARLHVLDALPRLPGGKPDFAALREMDSARQRPRRAALPSDPAGLAVARAWQAALPRGAPRGNASFEEAGGDSLRLMQFVFYLESQTGRHLPLDRFSMEMRPEDATAALEAGQMRPPNDRPCIVLLPGLNGDEPRLARFRAALQADFGFLVPAYPDWPQQAAQGRDFAGFVRLLEESLRPSLPPGRLLLAGYSFGGAVAASLADRLLETGREVAFLGVLDTNSLAPPDPNAVSFPRLAVRRVRQLLRGAARGQAPEEMAELLARHAAHPLWAALLRRWAKAGRGRPWPVPLRLRFAFHASMRMLLRGAALREWQTGLAAGRPLGVEPVLFRSQAHRAEEPRDLGWSRSAPGLRVVDVPGGHHSMLDPPARDALCACFRGEVLRVAPPACRHRPAERGRASMAPSSMHQG